MYDVSIAPEKIPSGGGFSIKNFSLLQLWSEHEALRNIWTKSNIDLPLVRYTGCKFKFYHPKRIDAIITYDNQLPLRSNMDMYHSMHAGIHNLQKNKIILTSKQTMRNKRKPYTIVKIKPPTILLNKWHFQSDIAKTPLLQIRTSSASLDQYYIADKNISTTLTIPLLNIGLIQNLNFKGDKHTPYSPKTWGTQAVYLYTCPENITDETQLTKLTLLANTNEYQLGTPFTNNNNPTYVFANWGNPFHSDYLFRKRQVYQSVVQPATIINNLTDTSKSHKVKEVSQHGGFTPVFLTDAIRYNPYRDIGEDTAIYFKSVTKNGETWEPPPDNPDLVSGGYPWWVLCYGFPDFQKHLGKLQHIDEEHILILRRKKPTGIGTETMVPISQNFILGNSPYTKGVDPSDVTRWWPCFQYQQEITNTISLAGPASPKIPPLESAEIVANYTFYFKWGGNPPPMSQIEDPRNEPTFPTPNNLQRTNSLQNPTTAPESILYNFDQRGHYITKAAIARLQKDWDTKISTFTDPQTRHLPDLQRQQEETSSESSSEEEKEETENLLRKLQQQRHKHKQLKLRILKRLANLKE